MNIELQCYRVQIGLFNSSRVKATNGPSNQPDPLICIHYNMTKFFQFMFLLLALSLLITLITKQVVCPPIVILCFSAVFLITLVYGIHIPIVMLAYSGHFNAFFVCKLLILYLSILCVPLGCISVFVPNISRLLICCGDIEMNPGPELRRDVKIMFSNINSISADDYQRFECLKFRASSEECNIILLCETGIPSEDDIDSKLLIPGFHRPFLWTTGRGIMVYISEIFPPIIRHNLMNHTLDCVWLELSGLKDNNKTIIGVSHRSPSHTAQQRKQYFKDLEENIRKARNSHNKNHSVILFGDFNSRNKMFWKDDRTDTAGREFYKLISAVALQNLIHEPTRIKGDSSSCIDLAVTDAPGKFQNVSVSPPIGRSDHSTIIASLDTSLPREEVMKKTIWQYDKCKVDELNNDISGFDWNLILDSENTIDQITDEFTDKLLAIYKSRIPSKSITIKPNDQPWINFRIKKELKIRDRLYKKMKNSRNEQDYKIYSDKCIEIKNLIYERKESYKSSLIDNLNDSNQNSKCYYGLLRKFLGNKFPSNIPTLLDPFTKKYSFSSKEKSNTLLQVFARKNHINLRTNPPPHFPARTDSKLEYITTNSEEVCRIIKSLDTSKASGLDVTANNMLKLSADSICEPLSKLFNKIFQCSNYPLGWKKGVVIPIHKKEKKDNPENYRPVRLLSSISKICEKVLFDRMFAHIKAQNLLYYQQSGFIKGHSTHDQLLAIVNHIHDNLEQGYSVKAIFLDITAAFDSVPHDLLLIKLKSYGFQGPLLDLLKSYLTNRRIQVRVNNSHSDFTNDGFINAGVAQGSLLGPLMFLLYINDLPDKIISNMFLYADDSSLYCTVDHEDYANSINVLQSDLNTVNDWAKAWGLEFKASKSWDLTFFSPSKKPPNLPDLVLNNNVIPKTSSHKHLGVILDERLNFSAHIDEIARKFQNMVNTLRPLSWQLNSKHLEKIYSTYMLPVLDHGDILYSSASQFQLSRLERIHYQAACYISGSIRGSNTSRVLENLNWNTLECRRKYHSGNYMFKAVNREKPSYILSILDRHSHRPNENYPLRNPRLFKFPNTSSSRFLNSPHIQLLKNYESIPEPTRSATSFEIFKRKLKNMYFSCSIKTPTTKLCLPRINEILINRMRAGLLLNSNRFSHNFQDTPTPFCPCGNIVQNERHILMHCTLVTNHRNTLLRTLATLGTIDHLDRLNIDGKIKFLLFGDNEFPLNLNTQIILATSKFLNSAKHLFHMKPKKQTQPS